MLPASIVCTNTSKSDSNVRSKTVIATLGDRSVVRSTDKVMNPASFAARLKTAVPAKIEGHQLFTVACKIYHMKLFERHRYFDWIWKNFHLQCKFVAQLSESSIAVRCARSPTPHFKTASCNLLLGDYHDTLLSRISACLDDCTSYDCTGNKFFAC